jgi:D-3-phosphoglycerate dehydrogenase
VAELTLALAICLLREVPGCNERLHAGTWKVGRWGTELAGKTVGILGTGAIGLRAAEIFKACKCKLVGWSRTEREAFTQLGGTYRPLDKVLAEADIVSVHVPLTPETKGLIGQHELDLMKPGACLINTARGRIVEKAALVHALQEKRIRAALDVFDEEPLPSDHPLTTVPEALLTPHIAFKTEEALHRRAQVTVGNIACFLEGSDVNRIA